MPRARFGIRVRLILGFVGMVFLLVAFTKGIVPAMFEMAVQSRGQTTLSMAWIGQLEAQVEDAIGAAVTSSQGKGATEGALQALLDNALQHTSYLGLQVYQRDGSTWASLSAGSIGHHLLTVQIRESIRLHGAEWGWYSITFQNDLVRDYHGNYLVGENSLDILRVAQWQATTQLIAGWVISILWVWFLAKHFIDPVHRLTQVVRKIARGDMTAKVNISGRTDELGQLASDIDWMSAQLAEARLQRDAADRNRRNMLQAISHDLRTPLTAILAHAEIVHDRSVSTKDQSTAIILEKGLYLKRLLDDLFELATLEEKQGNWQSVRTDIAELVRRALIGKLPELEAAGHQLEDDIPEEPLWAEVVADKVQRVVDNLLQNALKYGAEGKWLGVRAFRKANRIRVEIRDRGPGIPQAEREKIFERFYRSDRARNSKIGGSGLGLAIAREIIARHGGDVGVEGPEEGGCLFWFEIPTSIR